MSDHTPVQPELQSLSLTTRVWRVLPVVTIAAVIIAFDQWSKTWVRATLPKFEQVYPIPALGDFFLFQHVDNYGAAFGILQGQGNFFIVVALIVSAAILYYASTLPSSFRWVRLLLGLQMGGAIGNVLDRIYQGYVTDFIVTGIPGIYYIPNWNIADASIVCGVIGLGIFLFADDIARHRAAKHEASGDGQQTGSTSPAASRE